MASTGKRPREDGAPSWERYFSLRGGKKKKVQYAGGREG